MFDFEASSILWHYSGDQKVPIESLTNFGCSGECFIYTQLKKRALELFFFMILTMRKELQDINWFLSEILMIKESGNLTGQEHLGDIT